MGIFSRSNRHKQDGAIYETPEGYGVANKREAEYAIEFHKGLKAYTQANGGSIPTGKSAGDGKDATWTVNCGRSRTGYYRDVDSGVETYGTYYEIGEEEYDGSKSDESIKGYQKYIKGRR